LVELVGFLADVGNGVGDDVASLQEALGSPTADDEIFTGGLALSVGVAAAGERR